MTGHDPDLHDLDQRKESKASRDLFERSVARLDVAAGNRLRLARRDALNSTANSRMPRLLPAALAASALLAVGLAWWLPRASLPAEAVPTVSAQLPADAADAALSGDDDAELYAWLGDAPVAADPPQGEAL